MRLPKQTHKNANPDSRQTNTCNDYLILTMPGICIFSKFNIVSIPKKA